MKFYWFMLGALSVWRACHLLSAEDGPRNLFLHLRRFAGEGFWGDLLDCIYCLSLWIAIPFAWWLGEDLSERLLLWPALSAATIFIERWLMGPAPALYFENPENLEGEHHVLLRKKEGESEPANT